MAGINSLITTAYPELASQPELLQLIWKDLADGGLTNGAQLGVTMTIAGVFESKTTSLGARFLKFITAPPQTN